MKQTIEHSKPRKESIYSYWNRDNFYMSTIENKINATLDKTLIQAHLLHKCKCGIIVRQNYSKDDKQPRDIEADPVCPECGEIAKRRASVGSYTELKELSIKIFEDNKAIRFVILKDGYRYIFKRNNIIYIQRSWRITYNKKTHNLYYVEKDKNRKRPTRVLCINYSQECLLPTELFKYKKLAVEFMRRCYADQGIDLDKLINISLLPELKSKILNELLLRIKYSGLYNAGFFYTDCLRLLKPKERKKLTDRSISGIDVAKILIGRTEKSIRKLITEYPEGLSCIRTAANLFKTPEYVIKLIRSYPMDSLSLDTYSYNVKDFVEWITEPRLVRFLISNRHFIADTIRIRDLIVRDGGVLPNPADFSNLTGLHNSLARIQRRLHQTNRLFTYNADEIKLQMSIKDIEFKLPTDTFEVINVGEIMDMCVGAYTDQILNKECTIIVGYKNNIAHLCLELQKEKKKFNLHQAKLKYNLRPKNDDLDAVIEWCNNNKINYDRCSDVHMTAVECLLQDDRRLN